MQFCYCECNWAPLGFNKLSGNISALKVCFHPQFNQKVTFPQNILLLCTTSPWSRSTRIFLGCWDGPTFLATTASQQHWHEVFQIFLLISKLVILWVVCVEQEKLTQMIPSPISSKTNNFYRRDYSIFWQEYLS